jgi:hypothetical protein
MLLSGGMAWRVGGRGQAFAATRFTALLFGKTALGKLVAMTDMFAS